MAKECKVSVWNDGNVLKSIVTVAQLSEHTKTNELYTLNGWAVWYVNYILINSFLKKKISTSAWVFKDIASSPPLSPQSPTPIPALALVLTIFQEWEAGQECIPESSENLFSLMDPSENMINSPAVNTDQTVTVTFYHQNDSLKFKHWFSLAQNDE